MVGKRTRRHLRDAAAVLAVVLTLIAVCGCGSSEGGGTELQPFSQAAPSESEPSAESSASGAITWEEAQAIALERIPGADISNIVEMEVEYDDGRTEYEGSIYYNGYEYEFEIDGATGNILKWEIDD